MAKPPAPTNLKLLARAKPSEINFDEPQPEEGIPKCPSADPEVREIWDYTMKQLVVMKTVTMADRDLLYAYCEQVLVHRWAMWKVHMEGVMREGPHGLARHPAYTLAKDAATMMKTLGMLFGLSPSARTAIKVADQQAPKERGAGRLLTG